MDIPSLFMIPSAVSSGKVHSVFPNSTDADFDFNRDSDATRVNSEGLIERVGYYGSELILNPNFDDTSFWGLEAGVTIANNRANFNTAQTNYGIYKASLLTNSKTYKVQFEITDYTSGGVHFNIGGVAIGSYTALGIHTLDVSSGSGTNVFAIQSDSGGAVLSIDNVSVKEITGDRARLNYEIEGGLVNTKPSLLLEPQSTNLLPYSEDYTQSDWQKLGLGNGSSPVITKDYAISPDGTRNATRLQCNLNGGTTVSDQSLIAEVYSSSGNQTISLYMKSNTGSNQNIYFANTVTTGDTAVVTNEWQRFTFSHSSSTYVLAVGLRGNTGADNTADILIFAAQAEQQSYATSYIPTNGSVQTRTSETCNGAGTSSILPSEEGILYAEIQALASDSTAKEITISDGTTNNRVIISYNTANQIRINYRNSSSNIFDQSNSATITDFHKIAVKWKANDFSFYLDGSEVASSTSGSVMSANTLTTVNFDDGAGTFDFYGKVRDIRVYNTKEMTDSEVDILLTKITS